MIVGPTVGGMEPGRNGGKRPVWRGIRAEADSAMGELLMRGLPSGTDPDAAMQEVHAALMAETLRTGAPVPHTVDYRPDRVMPFSALDENLLPVLFRLGFHVVFDSSVGARLVAPLQTEADRPNRRRKVFLVSQTGDFLGLFWISDAEDWMSFNAADAEVFNPIGSLQINLACTSEDRTRGVVDAVLACSAPRAHEQKPEHGADLRALMRIGRELSIRRMGRVVAPLDSINYSVEVLARFKVAVEDIKGEHPGGRIVVLDGPPGTGKTYLVRALMDAVGDGEITFLLVSPEAIADLAGVEVLPVLVGHHSGAGPIVLILEDADSLLAARRGATMDRIASVLNLGDGLLGEALNLRLIVTTNAPIKELDPALLRPGRLSVRISCEPLGPEEARTWWRARNGRPDVDAGAQLRTLAELYALLRATGGGDVRG